MPFTVDKFWQDFSEGKFCFRIKTLPDFNRFKRLCHNHGIKWANKNDPRKEILRNDNGSLVNRSGTNRFTIDKNNYYFVENGALRKRRKVNNDETHNFPSIMTFDSAVFEDEIDSNGFEREL